LRNKGGHLSDNTLNARQVTLSGVIIIDGHVEMQTRVRQGRVFRGSPLPHCRKTYLPVSITVQCYCLCNWACPLLA